VDRERSADTQRESETERDRGYLREAWYAVSVVHAIRSIGIEVCAIASPRCSHLTVSCRVVVCMIGAEEKGVQGLEE
jgi:hypothetical protein